MTVPRPGVEPGSVRLEGGGSSIEHAGRRAERESNPRAIGCEPGTLPLSYDPAGREGIEPSLRVLEARPVTMTLHPKYRRRESEKRSLPPKGGHASIERRRLGSNRCTPLLHSPMAARRGIEPLSPHGQWGCDASRITGLQHTLRVTDGNRTRLRRVTVCPRPRRVPPPHSHNRGSSWSRTTFSWSSAERYHWTSSRPVPPSRRASSSAPLEGIEPIVARLKDEHPDR